MHVAARCNNREFYFTTLDDFLVLRDHLHQMCRTYEVTLYAYTLLLKPGGFPYSIKAAEKGAYN